MKVSVIGTGYVGLVAATCFADSGVSVTCMDVDEKKIANLRDGIIPIYEPGLEELVKRNTKEQRLFFTTNAQEAVENSDIIFIAVGTPSSEDGSADLTYVLNVASSVGKYMNSYKVVVDKSTVPVGTAKKVETEINKQLEQRGEQIEFAVVSNPEFMKEGAALEDFMHPDRVVIGTDCSKAEQMMHKLYAPFMRNREQFIAMSAASAEMTKYAANAMLATRISFMNEMANLCDSVGADVFDVRKGIGSDARIGSAFLYPGVGYGGSCFPKDVKAIVKTAKANHINLQVLDAVERVNDKQKYLLAEKIEAYYEKQGSSLKGKHIAMWGLAFKANTDDMRESSAIYIARYLTEKGATVCAFDPEATDNAKNLLPSSVQYANLRDEALKEADALLIVTEWNEFRNPDFELLSCLNDKLIVDGRNLFQPEDVKGAGLNYVTIGRDVNC